MVLPQEQTVFALLIILFVGLIISDVLKKFRLPAITSLIVLGAIIGPNGFDVIQSNDTLEFFGFLGSAFLMLMVGLEAKMEVFSRLKSKILILAFGNATIPFFAGLFIMKYFGYDWLVAILVGIVFSSSSIAIIASALKEARITKSSAGQSIISAALLMDITSLILLAVVLQNIKPITRFPLVIYFGLLLFSVYTLKLFLPEIAAYVFRHYKKAKDLHDRELRFVIIVLMAILLYFAGLGVHPIIGAFFVGLLLSDIITSPELRQKVHTLGYGIFVPVFFFIIGMNLNLGALWNLDYGNEFMLAIILGAISTKFLSGYISGRYVGFSKHHANIFGIGSTAQLTTTLAATYAAASLGIFDDVITTSIIVLSIITTIFSPLILSLLTKRKSHV